MDNLNKVTREFGRRSREDYVEICTDDTMSSAVAR